MEKTNFLCSNCGTSFEDDYDFCPKCGTKKESLKNRICPKCGTELCDGIEFCTKCGYQITNLGIRKKEQAVTKENQTQNTNGEKIAINNTDFVPNIPKVKQKIKPVIFFLLSPFSLLLGIVGFISYMNNDYRFATESVREMAVAFEGEQHVKMMEMIWLAVCFISLILILTAIILLIVGIVKSKNIRKVK